MWKLIIKNQKVIHFRKRNFKTKLNSILRQTVGQNEYQLISIFQFGQLKFIFWLKSNLFWPQPSRSKCFSQSFTQASKNRF